MYSPFEELEYLAEFLPDEGETVVVSRCEGELVCESLRDPDVAECNLEEPELYGRLIHANERLKAQRNLPLGVFAVSLYTAMFLVHTFQPLSMLVWILDLGLVLLASMTYVVWVQRRRAALFQEKLLPILDWYLSSRGIDRFVLIGSLPDQPELETLLAAYTKAVD